MHFKDVDTRIELPIMEHFYTIQGEGYYSGRAAYFVRLAGCDVGCVWCDVKESWDASQHPVLSLDALEHAITSTPTKLVVITGGEPALYNLHGIIERLHARGLEVAIETSGCYEVQGAIDWFCFSPKKFKAPHASSYDRANELKVVISHPSDFAWAESHADLVSSDCKLFLQPEWSKQERFLPLIIDYVKAHPKWRVSLQTHKHMNIP